MKTLTKVVSFILALTLLLTISVSAFAVNMSGYKYIKLSKEPLDMIHIVGNMPAIGTNPEVPIDEVAYLIPDDAKLSISIPEGGNYFMGMSMLDFPAGTGEPGYEQPLINEKVYSDGLYTYRVYDSQENMLEEINYITKGYSDQLMGLGFSITSVVEETVPSFEDVSDDAYYSDAVAWAVVQGITKGTTATLFSPNETCTRAQIITFLWRAAGSPESKNESAFTDVKSDAYYAVATDWAAENGMASGTTFSPNAPCTREMAVEFMWKHAGSPNAAEAGFTDVSSDAVNWAVEQGVTMGTSTDKFSPKETCTRAQIVTFLYRAFAE
jgi:hypothetical protein